MNKLAATARSATPAGCLSRAPPGSRPPSAWGLSATVGCRAGPIARRCGALPLSTTGHGERCRRRPGRRYPAPSPVSNTADVPPPMRHGHCAQADSHSCPDGRSAPAWPPAASPPPSGRSGPPCSGRWFHTASPAGMGWDCGRLRWPELVIRARQLVSISGVQVMARRLPGPRRAGRCPALIQ